ncbi:hypothetical protein FTUN_0132 [Frigoriglobus tundricola]|uniref:Uncharacterized protein n=1 Tax=Frigoriglobus tundricola TaxID=2774151 RepID=A0A6M5YF48_9BACT|nr:hypothetical protein FTUN_0132 [Frigoriglobus tundricola]
MLGVSSPVVYTRGACFHSSWRGLHTGTIPKFLRLDATTVPRAYCLRLSASSLKFVVTYVEGFPGNRRNSVCSPAISAAGTQLLVSDRIAACAILAADPTTSTTTGSGEWGRFRRFVDAPFSHR